jgi:hypothetical protein
MNSSDCGSILAALLRSGAGAKFLAESNFNFKVLFFTLFAISYFLSFY